MDNIKVPDELMQAQALANITDTAVRIPIIGIQVGLDFLIGLIPVVGDAIMTIVALRIVQLARRLGMPKHLQGAMIRNCLVDFGLGFLPIIGDIVDIFFKANKRNVRLMEKWWLEQHQFEIKQQAKDAVEQWNSESK